MRNNVIPSPMENVVANNIQSYRDILKDYLVETQAKNPLFSLRSMAKKIGITPGMLSSVLNGNKNLSLQKAMSAAEGIGLSRKKTDLFLALLEYERTEDPKLKSRLYDKIVIDFPDCAYQDLSIEHFKIVSDWYHFAIMEMMLLESAPQNHRDIAKALDITEFEAKNAIERLLKVGLLKNGENGLEKAQFRVCIHSKAQNLGIRSYHKQTLAKATEAIETQSNSEKFIGSETFPFDPEKLEMANQILEEAFNKIINLSEASNKKEVYHLGMQMFKLTNLDKGK